MLHLATTELPSPVPGYTKSHMYGPVAQAVADAIRGKSFDIQYGAKPRHCRFVDPYANVAPTLMATSVGLIEHQGGVYLLGPSDRERRLIIFWMSVAVVPFAVMAFGVSGGFSCAGFPWGTLLVILLVFPLVVAAFLRLRRGFWKRIVEHTIAQAMSARLPE